jgi:ABC-2 type transport system permease protein
VSAAILDAVRTEWLKVRTLPSTAALCAAAAAVTIAVGTLVAATTRVSSADPAGHDPTKLALTGVYLGQAVIAVLGVLAIGEEYGTGMIRATFTAIPQRLVVLAGKAVIVAALAALAGVIAVGGSLIAGRLLLPRTGLSPAHGYPLISITDGATMRAAVGTVVYLILVALLTLGVATALRDTAVSIGVVLGLLYLPLLLTAAVNGVLQRHLEQIAPMPAGLAIQNTGLHHQAIGGWSGLGVLACWAVATMVVGGLVLRSRDV